MAHTTARMMPDMTHAPELTITRREQDRLCCGYCRQSVAGGGLRCPSCEAVVHVECYRERFRDRGRDVCGTLGCSSALETFEGTRRSVPADRIVHEEVERRRGRRKARRRLGLSAAERELLAKTLERRRARRRRVVRACQVTAGALVVAAIGALLAWPSSALGPALSLALLGLMVPGSLLAGHRCGVRRGETLEETRRERERVAVVLLPLVAIVSGLAGAFLSSLVGGVLAATVSMSFGLLAFQRTAPSRFEFESRG